MLKGKRIPVVIESYPEVAVAPVPDQQSVPGLLEAFDRQSHVVYRYRILRFGTYLGFNGMMTAFSNASSALANHISIAELVVISPWFDPLEPEVHVRVRADFLDAESRDLLGRELIAQWIWNEYIKQNGLLAEVIDISEDRYQSGDFHRGWFAF